MADTDGQDDDFINGIEASPLFVTIKVWRKNGRTITQVFDQHERCISFGGDLEYVTKKLNQFLPNWVEVKGEHGTKDV